jgi:hypothetical protein
MQNNLKLLLKEILWIVLLFALTLLFAYLCLSWSFETGVVDIKFLDTYFFIPSWLILIPFFCLLAFLVSFFKEYRNRFRQTIPNRIFVILGVGLAFTLTILIRYFSSHAGMPVGGYVSYGPITTLNAVPRSAGSPAKLIADFLAGIQVLTSLLLLYGVFRIGKQAGSEKKSDLAGTGL